MNPSDAITEPPGPMVRIRLRYEGGTLEMLFGGLTVVRVPALEQMLV